jgi:hypothetical protein
LLLGALQGAPAPNKKLVAMFVLPRCLKTILSPLYLADSEIIEVKVCTDRQKDKILTTHTRICEFFTLLNLPPALNQSFFALLLHNLNNTIFNKDFQRKTKTLLVESFVNGSIKGSASLGEKQKKNTFS